MKTPWVPLNAQWWPAIAEGLQKPWPREAVLMDLRWWQDQAGMNRSKMPSRRKLETRWGWTEYRTRAAMRDEEEWTKPQKDPNKTPNRSQSHPKKTTQIPGITRAKTPKGSQKDPNKTPKGSTRAELQNTKHKTHTTDQNKHKGNKPKPDRASPVKSVFEEIQKIRMESMPDARPLQLTKSRRAAIKARIMEHSPEDVIAVGRWWICSKHPRAQYLRENGHGIDTLIRASKFATYLEMACEPLPEPKRRNGAIPSPEGHRKPIERQQSALERTRSLPGLDNYTAEQIRWATTEIEDLRESMGKSTFERAILTILAKEFSKTSSRPLLTVVG